MSGELAMVYITFGSNVEPETNLIRAVGLFRARLAVEAVSPVYRTDAIGWEGDVDEDRPYFLNTAIRVQTDLDPLALKLEVIRPIEAEIGRVRGERKGSLHIPLDADIALYGGQVISDEENRLHIPNPAILTDAYVAVPLAEIAPGIVHPISNEPLNEIAARLRNSAGIETVHMEGFQ